MLILYFFIKTLSKNANNQIFIEVIVSYEETADILLIDYFTCIGGRDAKSPALRWTLQL